MSHPVTPHNAVLGPAKCRGCGRRVFMFRDRGAFFWGEPWGDRHRCVVAVAA